MSGVTSTRKMRCVTTLLLMEREEEIDMMDPKKESLKRKRMQRVELEPETLQVCILLCYIWPQDFHWAQTLSIDCSRSSQYSQWQIAVCKCQFLTFIIVVDYTPISLLPFHQMGNFFREKLCRFHNWCCVICLYSIVETDTIIKILGLTFPWQLLEPC